MSLSISAVYCIIPVATSASDIFIAARVQTAWTQSLHYVSALSSLSGYMQGDLIGHTVMALQLASSMNSRSAKTLWTAQQLISCSKLNKLEA